MYKNIVLQTVAKAPQENTCETVTQGVSAKEVVRQYNAWAHSQQRKNAEVQSNHHECCILHEHTVQSIAPMISYWQTFGFLTNASTTGLAQIIAKHTKIDYTDDNDTFGQDDVEDI